MKNEHKKALEQYVFVAYHLKGMTLADWWRLDDEERAYVAGLLDQWMRGIKQLNGTSTPLGDLPRGNSSD